MRAPKGSLTAIVAFVAALAVAHPTPATTGWPQDGYDSGHSNANTQEWRLRRDNVGGLELLWSRSVRPTGITPSDFLFEGVSVPVVRGAAFASWWGSEVDPAGEGRLFLTRSRCATPGGCDPGADWWPLRGALLTLDARDGHTLWAVSGETETRRSLWTPNALANGLLTVSATRVPFRFRSRIAVLSSATGRVLWSDEERGVLLCISAVADGTVFATTAQGAPGGRVRAYGLA